MQKWILAFVAMLIAFSTPAQAERVRLGTTFLTDQKDRDTVNLPACVKSTNKKVSRLQVQVERYDAEINSLRVVYHNGQMQTLNVREKFRKGTTSRWLDLAGAARCIQKIIIVGDSDTRRRSNLQQSKITFWGFHPEGPPKLGPVTVKPTPIPVRPAPATVGVKLGKVRLTDAKDRDVISLPACHNNSTNTKVNRVQLAISNYPAEIDHFKVVFYNGEGQVLNVKEHFKANSKSRWLDLKGNARCIMQIIIIGDTDSVGRRPGQQATVTVRGMHFNNNGPVAVKVPPVQPTPAPAAVGVRLGKVRLTDAKDRDVISLPACHNNSTNIKVNRVQLAISNYPAEIDHFKVVFYNGEGQVLNVKEHFKANSKSRWLDLKGNARCIMQIIILGDTDSVGRRPGQQATVAVRGMHFTNNAPAPVKPVVANPSATPEKIGIRLGQVRLTDAKDKDVVNLPSCNGSHNERVNRVQLVVQQHPAEINRFRVQYHNGEAQVLDVKEHFKANTRSRWIDLKGNARCIKQFTIIGDTDSVGRRPGRQALVIVRGLHFVDNAPKISQPATAASNGTALGRVRLTDARDRDVIDLPRCANSANIPVRALRLKVTKYRAQIDRFRVVYQNGENELLHVRKTFQPNTSSRWIDLNGGRRCIDKIVIIGDTNSLGRRPGRQAVVHVRGR